MRRIGMAKGGFASRLINSRKINEKLFSKTMKSTIRQSKFTPSKLSQSKSKPFNDGKRYFLAGSIAILAVLGEVPTSLSQVFSSQSFSGEQHRWGDRALASTSGGRARGGSFDEPVPEPIPDYSGDGYGGYPDSGYGGYSNDGYFDQGGYPYEPSWPAPPSSSFPRAYPPVYVPAPYSVPSGYSGGSAGSVLVVK